jgi:hypothetical protein
MPSTAEGFEGEGTISLGDEEAVKQILSSAVMGLWNVVNDLSRLRPSHRDRYRVAIFGSARAKPGSFVYEEVKRAAAAFTEIGCDIVTGGGLMQAANEGAASVSGHDQHLGKLYNEEKISGTEALRLATNPESLAIMMRGLTTKDLQTSLVA